MAQHPRLTAPPPEPRREWPWHVAEWASIPCSVLSLSDRRLEAETYLSSGYGLRIALEARPAGWAQLGKLAQITLPNRTKATLVSQEYGIPFLTATQVFDIRPFPRKWLAVNKIEHAESLYVCEGTILVTRSGTVGRSILATANFQNTLISDDLLRVIPFNNKYWGWIYAYLRSPQARKMMTSAKYGHIIKHLEVSHLDALPVPVVKEEIAADFQERANEVLRLRNRAHQLTLEAEERFEQTLGLLSIKDLGERGFTIRASEIYSKSRRLEAAPHNPGVRKIREHLSTPVHKFGNVFC